jgi:hypothetical protein
VTPIRTPAEYEALLAEVDVAMRAPQGSRSHLEEVGLEALAERCQEWERRQRMGDAHKDCPEAVRRDPLKEALRLLHKAVTSEGYIRVHDMAEEKANLQALYDRWGLHR